SARGRPLRARLARRVRPAEGWVKSKPALLGQISTGSDTVRHVEDRVQYLLSGVEPGSCRGLNFAATDMSSCLLASAHDLKRITQWTWFAASHLSALRLWS